MLTDDCHEDLSIEGFDSEGMVSVLNRECRLLSLGRAQGAKAFLMCIDFQLKLKVDLTKFSHLAIFVNTSAKRTIGTDTSLPPSLAMVAPDY